MCFEIKIGLAAENTTTFSGTVPFTCSYTGDCDNNVEMSYTRNNDHRGSGGTGRMMGTSEPISIESNKVPRLDVRLQSVLQPHPASFRGVWVRSMATNQYIQYVTSNQLTKDPDVTMSIPSSKLIAHSYTVGQQNDITLTVSANVKNFYPFVGYQFDVVLTSLGS